MRTISQALTYARTLPALDTVTAHALITYVTGQDRAWILAHPEAPVSPDQDARITDLFQRAAQGEPLAYLTGEREFYNLLFYVTPDVLVPRPDTEELVTAILHWLEDSPLNHGPAPRLLDLGTGSGIIAVTLAVNIPQAYVTAADLSAAALCVARANAERHQVADRIRFVQSDLLASISGTFHIIAANLPYIAAGDLPDLDAARWEPALALDGGAGGLDLFRRFLSQAPPHLTPGGVIFLEIGYDQGPHVADLCRFAFPGARVHVRQDLGDQDRVVIVET